MKKTLRFLAAGYLIVLVIAIISAAIFFPEKAFEQNVDTLLLAPQAEHWFGTDSLGRDFLFRILSGGQVSLVVGILCALLSFVIGVSYGALSGWFEGRVDKVLMRFCDIMMAIPSFMIVAVLCLSLQMLLTLDHSFYKDLFSLSLAISLTHWMGLARVTRAKVIEIKRRPFVEAAISLGGTASHVVWRHILPNILGTLMLLVAMQVPTNILYESFMSFIGLGMHPPVTSWGLLVREGWKSLSSFPHLILFPSLILFLTVWSFHVLLDAAKSKLRL